MHHAIHWIKRELWICQSLLCHILGSFRVLSQIRPQAPLLVGLIFMFNVLSALTGFRPRLSHEILCIAKLMTANFSAECPTPHMRRICSMAHIHNTCNIHCLLSFLLDDNILGKWFCSSSSWNERGTFLWQEYFQRGIFFLITVLNEFQKNRRRVNYSHYSFISIRKQ